MRFIFTVVAIFLYVVGVGETNRIIASQGGFANSSEAFFWPTVVIRDSIERAYAGENDERR